MLKERLLQWWKQEGALCVPIKHCKICFKEINDYSFYSLIHKNNCLCEDCYKKFEPKFIRFKVEKYNALSIYEYDQTIRELLYKFKGCYDIELNEVFFARILWYLRFKYKGYYVIPVPSFHLDDKKRGFNHVQEIFSRLNLPMLNIVEKAVNVKQANLSKKERKKTKNRFKINNPEQLKDKKVLVVDDVYTTGSSMKAVVDLVKKGKPQKIEVLVMAKNVLKTKK